MGNFRPDSRGGFRGRSGGSRFGGRPKRSFEMHDVTCDKCGKQCQVPFKPTLGKPVFCSDCFRKNEGSRNQDGFSQSGMSAEQFSQINAKLDKIIQALEISSEDDSEADSETE